MKSPFNPNVREDDDTTRFDNFDEEEPWFQSDALDSKDTSASKKNKKRKDINFPGYTYKKEVEEQKSNLVQAIKSLLDTNEHGHEQEDDGNQSPPEQEQKIPTQQVRLTAQGQLSRQQNIEMKNKQIAIKNTNLQN
jgi:serine/threonine kinase 38